MYKELDLLQKMSKDFIVTNNLVEKFDDALVAPSMAINDNKPEDAVLIFGLNPAGGSDAVEFEKLGGKYLYSVPDYKEKIRVDSDWIARKAIGGGRKLNIPSKNMGMYAYPFYYGHYYDLFTSLYGEHKWKWGWCNENFEDIEDSLKKTGILVKSNLEKQINNVKDYYYNCSDAEFSVYAGDLFYYHETKSKELDIKKIAKKDREGFLKYIKDFIDAHIKVLETHKKNVKYVLVCPNKPTIKDVLGINMDSETTIVEYPISSKPVYVGRFIKLWNSPVYYSNAKELLLRM